MRQAGAVALIVAGAVAALLTGVGAAVLSGPALEQRLLDGAQAAIAAHGGRGVSVTMGDGQGWITRRASLSGGAHLGMARRSTIARAVAAVPGMSGAYWPAPPSDDASPEPDPLLVCQTRVDGILKARSIRFADASANIDPVSRGLLDEVAAALSPCEGSVVAINGHTNATGDEAANEALSRERALAVRNALGARGIDLARLRARGFGSQRPLPGLDAADPANRRIEFAIIAPVSVEPTVIDTPRAGDGAGDGGGLPLWAEMQVLLLLTYAVGITIGWTVWGRARSR
ncbi:MAG TPA: OmpA family protein [Novosphingobium sp.]|nr:OmpA family protein [Novosphingobium sp.]